MTTTAVSTDPPVGRVPTRAPRASACEPYRELIERAVERGRNAMAIWQDLVDDHGFTARYVSVRRDPDRKRKVEAGVGHAQKSTISVLNLWI